jgi:predicted metal-dependent enzyme (double-stranded beta helix superfamily)
MSRKTFSLQEVFKHLEHLSETTSIESIHLGSMYYKGLLHRYNATDWIPISLPIVSSLYNTKEDETIPKYTRQTLFTNSHFDVLLIVWSPGSTSKIHNHPDNGCVIKVLRGSLSEERFSLSLDKTAENIIEADKVSYIDNTIGYHRICNKTNEFVFSLHIYSPPNYVATLFPS